MTRRTPSPTARSWGTIILRPSRSTPASRPSTPNMRGTEKPHTSASSTPMVRPLVARAAARLTVTEDLPTPPLPDATKITRVLSGTDVSSWRWLTLKRALAMAEDFSLLGHLGPLDVDLRHPGAEPTRLRMSRWIWARSGQPEVVRATVTTTVEPSTATLRTMPRSMMSLPSSGSTTPRSRLRTFSGVGGAWSTASVTPRILPVGTV